MLLSDWVPRLLKDSDGNDPSTKPGKPHVAVMPLAMISPPLPPLTRMDSVRMGWGDPQYANAQNVAHLPYGEDMGNSLGRSWAFLQAPNLDTSGIPMKSMDSYVNDR